MKRYADAAVTAVIGFCIFEGITDGSVSVNPLYDYFVVLAFIRL